MIPLPTMDNNDTNASAHVPTLSLASKPPLVACMTASAADSLDSCQKYSPRTSNLKKRPHTQQKDASDEVLTFVMTIEYNGFAYAGFQRQTSTPAVDETAESRLTTNNITMKPSYSQQNKPNKKKAKVPITIQQQIENALEKWTNLPIATLRVRGAGRTDKGVHASGQVVAFDIPVSSLQASNEQGAAVSLIYQSFHSSQIKNDHTNEADNRSCVDYWQIRRAISTRLPPDIVIRTVWLWNGDFPFEARQRISCKTYTYKLRFRSFALDTKEDAHAFHPICNAGPHLLRRVRDHNDVWLCPWPLDETTLPSACKAFVGMHDFYNFVHKEEHKKRRKCNNGAECNERKYKTDLLLFDVDLEQDGGDRIKSIPPVYNATFTLKARGFYRQMVRNLVGFVVDVARGKQMLTNLPTLLRKNDENINHTVNAAPACGLCLEKVLYECNHFVMESSS